MLSQRGLSQTSWAGNDGIMSVKTQRRYKQDTHTHPTTTARSKGSRLHRLFADCSPECYIAVLMLAYSFKKTSSVS